MIESWGDLVTTLASLGILWLLFGLRTDGTHPRENGDDERAANPSRAQVGRRAPR